MLYNHALKETLKLESQVTQATQRNEPSFTQSPAVGPHIFKWDLVPFSNSTLQSFPLLYELNYLFWSNQQIRTSFHNLEHVPSELQAAESCGNDHTYSEKIKRQITYQ